MTEHRIMGKLVHIVADYGAGDLAFPEMIAALARHLPDDYKWAHTSVASFDTIATGFVVAQLGLQDATLRPKHTIIYANCAPRRDRHEPRRDNEGEGLLYGLLDNGVPVIAVNSGYSLSFVRDHLAQLHRVNVERGGSQFRSRDVFPPVVGKVARGENDFIGQGFDPLVVIPSAPNSVVAYIDSFGNLKTTIREGDDAIASLTPGQRVRITIGRRSAPVTVAAGSFNVQEGDIAFAPGSSGHRRRFWEVFRRGSSACEYFDNPPVGSHIAIEQ